MICGGISRYNADPRDPGQLPPGPQNAITDVAGVRVGHATVISGEGPLRIGEGPVRDAVARSNNARIIAPGYLTDRSELARWLASADIYVSARNAGDGPFWAPRPHRSLADARGGL